MIALLFKFAPLHDIGRVGMPERILLKPRPFSPAEFEIMQAHTALGRDAMQHAADQLGMEVEFVRFAKKIACGHQKKWDGTGCLQGIDGEDRPIPARLQGWHGVR